MYSKFSIAIGIFLLLFLALIFFASNTIAEDIKNLVKNPDFEVDTGGWSIGAGGILSIDKKEKFPIGSVVKAQIDAVGANDWEPEIHSPSFDVKNGVMYTMSFWAKTEQGLKRTLGIKFEQLDTWTGPATSITLDDKMTEYHYSPIMTMGSPPQVVVHIQFNKALEDVWFAHFRVYEGKWIDEKIDLGGKKIAVSPNGNLTTTWGNIRRQK